MDDQVDELAPAVSRSSVDIGDPPGAGGATADD
jgi:hypothetical protein